MGRHKKLYLHGLAVPAHFAYTLGDQKCLDEEGARETIAT